MCQICVDGTDQNTACRGAPNPYDMYTSFFRVAVNVNNVISSMGMSRANTDSTDTAEIWNHNFLVEQERDGRRHSSR